MKKIINISLLLLLSLALIVGCNKNNKQNDEVDNNTENDNKTTVEVNMNEDVIKNQNIDGIEITNTSLVYEDGISYLNATVTNHTGTDYELSEYRISVKDSNGNVIVTIPGYIGNILKDGESKLINTMISEDLSKATSIEYEVIK